ncbi:di-heme oxidoredictase family protein [Curvivirga sp.]|uniref:di-heme oxidoredictase family protein n=1 Tax=Curvivirga sp. TaxID=2856848 RepID=UPI003B592FD7
MKRIFFLIFNSLILFATASAANAQSIFQNIEDPRQLEQVNQGRKIFNRDWQAFPGVNPNGDGLGPVFNRVSCSGCHFQAGRGRPPESPDEPFTSMVLRLGFTDELGSRAHIAYGEQLNDRSLPNIPAEGRPSLSFRAINGQYVDGERYTLRMPQYDVKDLGFGQLGWAIQFSGRVAQPLQGIGLLEAIPQEVINGWSDPNDLDDDGISGRVAMVLDQSGSMSPARFGWKAAQVSLFSQTAQALHQDMGLTSSLHLEQNCTWEQLACRAAPKENGPEVNAAQLDQLVSFQRALSPRSQQNRNELGRYLFNEIGCNSCHIPTVQIPEDTWPRYLAGQKIHPYSDMLLHDMGDGLSDGLFQGNASPSEWRTAPLWGLSQRQPLRLLHDGRARSVAEAILWHDGEARISKEAFRHLQKHEREALTDFVEGL